MSSPPTAVEAALAVLAAGALLWAYGAEDWRLVRAAVAFAALCVVGLVVLEVTR